MKAFRSILLYGVSLALLAVALRLMEYKLLIVDHARELYIGGYFRQHMPDNGVPARFTVHVVDVPDKAASYEFYGVGLYQKALHQAPAKK